MPVIFETSFVIAPMKSLPRFRIAFLDPGIGTKIASLITFVGSLCMQSTNELIINSSAIFSESSLAPRMIDFATLEYFIEE